MGVLFAAFLKLSCTARDRPDKELVGRELSVMEGRFNNYLFY